MEQEVLRMTRVQSLLILIWSNCSYDSQTQRRLYAEDIDQRRKVDRRHRRPGG